MEVRLSLAAFVSKRAEAVLKLPIQDVAAVSQDLDEMANVLAGRGAYRKQAGPKVIVPPGARDLKVITPETIEIEADTALSAEVEPVEDAPPQTLRIVGSGDEPERN
jgi:hypothetical protein